MTHTAPNPKRELLHARNRRYLFLRSEIDREVRMFRYPARLIEEMTSVRNDIVEIQNSITNPQRREVIAQ